VKSINARITLILLLLGVAAVSRAQAEDYYIYQTPKGELVLTNKEPPPGSKIIKRISFPDATDNPVPQQQPPNNPQPNAPIESSPKPSKAKWVDENLYFYLLAIPATGAFWFLSRSS
jgi:hypothetical protein